MRLKIMTILFLLMIIVFGLGITYSAFSSENDLIVNQEIASFIFEANQTDQISLSLSDMKPGDEIAYNFSVSNSNEVDSKVNVSNVKINYQIIISTFHFIPLDIKLYKGDSEEALVVCDEKTSRNDNNEVVCTSEIQEMNFESGITDDYVIKAKFDEQYNSIEYSDLVDYIDIEIKSWQKVGES